ncbi:MAG: hypothetical protein Q9191_001300 [Dirinaria sp. TL-2023a]
MVGELQDKLQQSERLRLLGAYGDYISKFLADVRRSIAQSLYWTDVNKALLDEEDDDNMEHVTIKALLSVAAVFKIPYVHLRQLVRLYSDRNKLVHNDVRQLIAERKWNDLGRTLEADTHELRTSLVGALTYFERDAIEFVIEHMKNEFFDTIEPGEGGIKINDVTHQADLDHVIQGVWDKLLKSGETSSLAHLGAFRTIWEDKWAKKDIDSLEERFKARMNEAAEGKAKAEE